MTPADLLRAVTPYNPALPQEEQVLGTNNPLMDAKALGSGTPAATQEEYSQLLGTVWAGGAGAAAAAKQAFALRSSGAVDTTVHVAAVNALPSAAGGGPPSLSAFQAKAAAVLPGAHFVSGTAGEEGTSAAAAFAALVDQDGDGLISFGEFMVLLTVLSLPPAQLDVAFRLFDGDGSGTLDAAEYNGLLQVLRSRTAAGQQVKDMNVLGQSLGRLGSVALPQTAVGAGTPSDPRRLTLAGFAAFVRRVRAQLHHVEFERYGGGSGALTPRQFALLIVGNAPPALQAALTARLQQRLPEAGDSASIPLQEVERYFLLLEELPDLTLAMSLAGPMAAARTHLRSGVGGDAAAPPSGLTRAEFGLVTGVTLTDHNTSGSTHAGLSPGTVDVLFALFDENQDGLLSVAEVQAAMAQHASRGLAEPRSAAALGAGVGGFVACVKAAFTTDEAR